MRYDEGKQSCKQRGAGLRGLNSCWSNNRRQIVGGGAASFVKLVRCCGLAALAADGGPRGLEVDQAGLLVAGQCESVQHRLDIRSV